MSSENETSAESPEMDDEQPQEKTSSEPKRIEYILVRHMGRSPRTRTLRAARGGHRRQGVLLKNGQRIRKKGRKRLTQLHLKDFVENHTRLLEYVRVGAIEFVNPVTLQPIPYDDLLDFVHDFGSAMVEDFELDESGLQTGVIPGQSRPDNAAPEGDDEVLGDGDPETDDAGDNTNIVRILIGEEFKDRRLTKAPCDTNSN